MKKYLLTNVYLIMTLLIGTLLISTLHYYNLTSDNITNILKLVLVFVTFLIFGFKQKDRNKKQLIKLSVPICLILFIISLFTIGFYFKNLVYYLLIIGTTLFTSLIKRKEEE